jgi:uroporphyrinogen-III synthase
MSNSLSGLKILVTRPAHQADHLCHLIESQGGEAVRLPTLEIIAIENNIALNACQLERFDIAIFISVNAVDHAIPTLLKSLSPVENKTFLPQIMTVGQRTATRLKDWGFTALSSPPPSNSETLLAIPELQAISGKKIVIFRGEGGRELLAETLKQRGAQVEYINVYRRVLPTLPTPITMVQPDIITVTSNESLHHLLTMLKEQPWVRQTPFVVISERIRLEAIALGIQAPILVAPTTSDEGILQALWKSQQSAVSEKSLLEAIGKSIIG